MLNPNIEIRNPKVQVRDRLSTMIWFSSLSKRVQQIVFGHFDSAEGVPSERGKDNY